MSPPQLICGPFGPIEILITGSGEPITVFGHGVAGSISSTRPFATLVPGTRVFLHFRGHGASVAPPGPWRYEGLAAELLAVAEYAGATRAVGISMGAGALTRLLVDRPDRFERVAFLLPAVLDRVRTGSAAGALEQLAQRVESGDVQRVKDHLLQQQPATLRAEPAVLSWCTEQARALVGTPVGGALRTLATMRPLTRTAQLETVEAPALVVGQEGDDLHPAQVARDLALALPHGRAEIFGPGGLLWAHRGPVRRLIGNFLADTGRVDPTTTPS